MEQQPGSSSFTPGKVIGVTVMIVGLVMCGLLFFADNPLTDCLLALVLYVFFGWWIIMIEEGIKTGKLIIRHGHVYLDKTPKTFWLFVAVYIIIILFFLVGYTGYQLEALSIISVSRF